MKSLDEKACDRPGDGVRTAEHRVVKDLGHSHVPFRFGSIEAHLVGSKALNPPGGLRLPMHPTRPRATRPQWCGFL